MTRCEVLSVLLLLVVVSFSRCLSDTCESSVVINLVVQEEIDGTNSTALLEDLDRDVFSILISDQTINTLCPKQVNINVETTILQILNCSVSNIEPGAFEIVPQLALLKISRNVFTAVKKGVFNGIKTKELDLSHNLIASVDQEAFDGNPYLQIIKLDYNQIKELNSGWFAGSPNVYKLSIIFNEVSEIPANSFKNMDKSRALKLQLSANMLLRIHSEAFNELTRIDLFKINGNKLTELPEELFINRTIRSLEADTNKLRCFPDTLFDSGVENIEFLENPQFECECLKKVREFVEGNNIEISYPAIICEDKVKQVNVVYNYNKTYEIPLFPPALPASTDGVAENLEVANGTVAS